MIIRSFIANGAPFHLAPATWLARRKRFGTAATSFHETTFHHVKGVLSHGFRA
jgi:hypothetical protein